MANNYILGCSQFGKLKRCKTIGVEDQISDLPDEILLHILDWLTLKEAVATGILSKRWKNLWASCPNLDFGCFQEPDLFKYLVIIERILQQNNAPKLHKLRIVHPSLVQDFGHHIDDWISFAVRRGVSELELNFNVLYRKGDSDQYYVHSHVFGLPNPGKQFDSLKDLCLRSVNLSDEVFDLILSKCCSLERFLLMFNHGLVNAKNTAPHLKLKSLELYLNNDLEYLQLLVPNLISFKYQGRKRSLCIKDAKHLASLRLSTSAADPEIFLRRANFCFSKFSSYLSKLESLVVSASLLGGLTCFIKLDAFSNLKQLKLEVDYEYSVSSSYKVAASIMRVAPFLELFEIILPYNDCRRRFEALELGSMSPHQNLKEVKLIGFRGDGNTMEFLHYLVEYAVSLQKIDITALGAVRIGDGLRMQRLADRKAKHCNKCVLQLRQTLHPNVQLLYHDD